MSQNSSSSLGKEVADLVTGELKDDKPKKPSMPIWKRIGYTLGLPLWVFLGFMLAQAIIVLVLRGLTDAGVRFDSVNGAMLNVVLSAVVYIAALAIVIGVPFLLKRKTSLSELGVGNPPKWYEFLAAPAGMVVYYILSFILVAFAMQFLTFIDFEQVQDTGFNGITQHFDLMMAFVGLVIVAPIAEEVLFRGYLLGKLRKYAPVWLAVLITSALFAAVHFQWNVAIDTFALSLVLCFLRIFTGSLWPSIMLHMIKNGLAFYLLFINPSLLSTLGG